MLVNKRSIPITITVGLISILPICTIALNSIASDESPEPTGPAPITIQETQSGNFEYILENRPDPFMPFISEKAATTAPQTDEIIETEIDLSGMRQFEPGQLTLVAILSSNALKMAMVEDVTGKGYIINEGTAIGRRGVVTEIQKEQVLITETAHTRSGKELVNTIVMRLKKEGE